MLQTKYRVYFVWSHDKEEKWLNEMSKKGLHLVKTGFCKYVFEENQEKQYIYRLELLKQNIKQDEKESYLDFLRETGVEQVGQYFNWVYFRKQYDEKEFEMFSDLDSKISHYNRMITLLMILFAPNMLFLVNSINNRNSHPLSIFTIILHLLIVIVSLYGTLKLVTKVSKLKTERNIME